uniref:tRNA-uridine aminocarboxypropyltransferase 1 n=1 Tax=Syphacia muris TaxID=451379 RepID=A0A0N5ALB8_9BILA
MNEQEFQISSFCGLKEISKQTCSSCGRKRMYFCYDCRSYMPSTLSLVPTVELPYKIDIIKHRNEKNGKSTALHCLLLAPLSTTVYDAPKVPDYSSIVGEKIVFYPSVKAKSIEEFLNDNGKIDRFVFLDATWFQVGGLLQLPEVQNLPHVKLNSYKTLYWRPQVYEYLATAEAVYYAVREAYQHDSKIPYDGRFDNLLFWFFYFRGMVNSSLIEKNFKNRISSKV